MSLSQREAHHAAQQFLNGVFRDQAVTVVLETDLTEEYDWAWAVRFDSREHIDTGDPATAPTTRVVVVPKSGEVPYFPPADVTGDELRDFLAAIRPPR